MAHRILILGKNKHFPKTVRFPIGFGADGVEVTYPVQIKADECLCTVCHGHGELRHTPINPSERDYYTRCTACDGEGIATVRAA